MLLAIDIGNTTTGFALYRDDASDRMSSFFSLLSASLKSDEGREYCIKNLCPVINSQRDSINYRLPVIVSSVVPDLNSAIVEITETLNLCEPLFVDYFNNKILSFTDVDPQTLGADRIAATAGAYGLCGGPVAVVDFGTATTVSVADSRGVFLGGVIMPGLKLMLNCLKDNTAQLPEVQLQGVATVLGKETTAAMISGIVIGTAGAVERILRDIEKENRFKLQLVLTGGNSGFMRPYIRKRCRTKPFLIYEGLRRIYLRNKS